MAELHEVQPRDVPFSTAEPDCVSSWFLPGERLLLTPRELGFTTSYTRQTSACVQRQKSPPPEGPGSRQRPRRARAEQHAVHAVQVSVEERR